MSNLAQVSMVALALGMGAALSTPVTAADFTFHVPVNLTNIHEDVVTVRVACEVRDRAGGRILGQQWTDLRNIPDDGNLRRDVTVSFDIREGRDRGAAQVYTCSLLFGTGRGPFRRPGRADTPDNLKPRAGSRAVLSITGNL